MYGQFTVKNVHITHTSYLNQGDRQEGILVVFVNSDGKIKTSGQTPPKELYKQKAYPLCLALGLVPSGKVGFGKIGSQVSYLGS